MKRILVLHSPCISIRARWSIKRNCHNWRVGTNYAFLGAPWSSAYRLVRSCYYRVFYAKFDRKTKRKQSPYRNVCNTRAMTKRLINKLVRYVAWAMHPSGPWFYQTTEVPDILVLLEVTNFPSRVYRWYEFDRILLEEIIVDFVQFSVIF